MLPIIAGMSATVGDFDQTVQVTAESRNSIIFPEYGLAVAKGQYPVVEEGKKGKNVRFGIHPITGRMPGQRNVILAEATNDTVNFAAEDDPSVEGNTELEGPPRDDVQETHPYPIHTSPRLESLAQLVAGGLCTAYRVHGIGGKLPANCLDRYAVSPNYSSSLESETSILDQDLRKIESERKQKMLEALFTEIICPEMLPDKVEILAGIAAGDNNVNHNSLNIIHKCSETKQFF